MQGVVHGYEYKVRKEDFVAMKRMNPIELLRDMCIRKERIAKKLAENKKVRATPAACVEQAVDAQLPCPRSPLQCTFV